jgi:hypothetical protein
LFFIDQLTTNVPQGAQRLNDKIKVSIKIDDDDHSNEIDQIEDKNQFSDKSLIEDNYPMKIKIKNKDKVELINENEQSISNQQKEKIDTSKDLNILIESKKKNIYQPESIEIDGNIINRFDPILRCSFFIDSLFF